MQIHNPHLDAHQTLLAIGALEYGVGAAWGGVLIRGKLSSAPLNKESIDILSVFLVPGLADRRAK